MSYCKSMNRSGVTMFFVLMFMVIASLLGSSLMYLSSKQSEAGGDYYAKKTAEDAAESALDWFRGSVEDFTVGDTSRINSVIKWMEDFDNESINNRWYNYSNSDPDDINSKDISSNFSVSTEQEGSFIRIGEQTIRAKLKIERVDEGNKIVVVRGVGYGKNNSRKTIRAVFKLEGLQSAERGNNMSTEVPTNAIYLDGDGRNFDIPVTVDGDVYAGGNFNFQGGGTSTINGNFYSAPSDNESIIAQNLVVKGNSYIQSPIKLNGYEYRVTGNFASESAIYGTNKSKGLVVEGNAYLYDGVSYSKEGSKQANTYLQVNNNLYLNQNNILEGDGNPFINVGSNMNVNYVAGQIGNMNGRISISGDLNLYDPNTLLTSKMSKVSVAKSTSVETDFIEDPLASESAFKAEIGEVTRSAAQTQYYITDENISKINNLSDLGIGKINATKINELCENQSLLNSDGFLVINVDQSVDWESSTENFDGKVMFIVNDHINMNGALWNSSTTSNTLFDVRNDGSINGLGNSKTSVSDPLFRGYIHVQDGGKVDLDWKGETQFNGAVHFVGKDYDLQWNSGGVDSGESLKIKYDENVLKEYAYLNLWDDRSGSEEEEEEGTPTEIKFSTSVIKPRLISKY